MTRLNPSQASGTGTARHYRTVFYVSNIQVTQGTRCSVTYRTDIIKSDANTTHFPLHLSEIKLKKIVVLTQPDPPGDRETSHTTRPNPTQSMFRPDPCPPLIVQPDRHRTRNKTTRVGVRPADLLLSTPQHPLCGVRARPLLQAWSFFSSFIFSRYRSSLTHSIASSINAAEQVG